MVQWLKRSPKTHEVVSSSLNSDLYFFLAVILHILMFNYFNKAKLVSYAIKSFFRVFFYLQLYILLFFLYIYLFSNFITVLGIFKFHPRSRLRFLSSESRFYNHRFRHLIPRDVTRPIIHLDALQSGQCLAVIDWIASSMSSFILVRCKARHKGMLLWVGLA